MHYPSECAHSNASIDTIHELTSLARLILFARQTARDLGADFPTYLLELAHGAVQEEIHTLAEATSTD
jgi:hypothetical protein